MTIAMLIVLGIIAIALVLFMSHIVPVDVTAIIVMVLLMVTGILTPNEGLAGFSNSATVTILALLIISTALKNTGAVEELGNQMMRITGKQEWFTLLVIMLVSAVTSAFINTTAVVAVFIPVMFRISKALNIHVAILLIPLSFASMVGGTSTMIGTSTNLLINSMAVDGGLKAFPIFHPAIMGLIFLVALVVFMLLVGRFLIPKRSKHVRVFDKDIVTKQYITELAVRQSAEIVGKHIDETGLLSPNGPRLMRVIRKDHGSVKPEDYDIVEAGDCLVVKADVPQIVRLGKDRNVRIRTMKIGKGVPLQDTGEAEIFEVLIHDNSNLLGQRIRDVDFRGHYDAIPLGIKKMRVKDTDRLMNHKLQFGDILLLSGTPHEHEEQTRNNWVPIQRFSSEEIEAELPRRSKMWISIGIVAAVVLLAVLRVLPISVSAWAGVVGMFLTGCITFDKAYYNVEWKVIFLLAGIIPLGTAMSNTGTDALIADGIIGIIGGQPLPVVVGVLFVTTVLLTGIVSNQATAILLVPIALQMAGHMGLPAQPLLMTILFGATSSFLTPVGYQTNAMILGPGDYRFSDFFRVGGLLSLLFLILAVIFIPILYG